MRDQQSAIVGDGWPPGPFHKCRMSGDTPRVALSANSLHVPARHAPAIVIFEGGYSFPGAQRLAGKHQAPSA